MNRKSLITLAIGIGFATVAVSGAFAGDRTVSYPDSKQPVATKKTSCSQQTRCDRRCARLLRMVQKRGCSCPEVARAIHPVRYHTYLSSHYPPFRYSR